jgi:hypothetical protein
MSVLEFSRDELQDYIEGLGYTDITPYGWTWAETLFTEGLDYRQIAAKLEREDMIIE